MEASDVRIAKEIFNKIDAEFKRIGLLHRVFYRVKSFESLTTKLNKNPNKYSSSGKKIQDLFGFRITLYFPDDLEIAQNLISSLYEKIDETVDEIEKTIFNATRCNFVYRLPAALSEQSRTIKSESRIDNTFEVQFRTVLSEGWHEVEHDLRYKCRDDWQEYDDLSRALNGILATLETSDWGMSKLFQDLSYRHYKAANWEGMIRTKFRVRTTGTIKPELIKALSENNKGKAFFRLDRKKLLNKIVSSSLVFPITLENIVYLSNFLYVKCPEIEKLTPRPLKSMFSEHFQNQC